MLLEPPVRKPARQDQMTSTYATLGMQGADNQYRQMHAKDKAMTVYMIADIKITDNKWIPTYAASVHELVHKHGGKYLSRSGNVKTLEGSPLDTNLIAIMAFPSAKAAESFVTDPAYIRYAAARRGGSESRFQLIDDTDL